MTEAMPIEVRKIAYRQSAKDGLVITFAVHPNDMPAALAAAPIGTRFMAALVEIGDDEKPVATKAKPNHTVMTAGRLCTDPMFQIYCEQEFPRTWGEIDEMSPADRAAEVVRQVCQVSSRKELATDQTAANAFDGMVAKFEMWRRGE